MLFIPKDLSPDDPNENKKFNTLQLFAVAGEHPDYLGETKEKGAHNPSSPYGVEVINHIVDTIVRNRDVCLVIEKKPSKGKEWSFFKIKILTPNGIAGWTWSDEGDIIDV